MNEARRKLVEQAARFLVRTEGKALPNGCVPSQQLKQKYLIEEKGLTFEEYLEALNIASNGEVVRSAFGGGK